MKTANLVEYDMINRGSTLFVNTGAKAREFTVEFPLTINHIMRSYNSVLNAKSLIKSVFTKTEKDRFNVIETPTAASITPANQVTRQWRENLLNNMEDSFTSIKEARVTDPSHQEEADSWRQIDPFLQSNDPLLNSLSVQTPAYSDEINAAQSLADDDANARLAYEAFRNNNGISETAMKALDSLSFMLDIIRTSVAPNQQNTVLGPPIIRVRHGTMYLDVPCICKSFNISIEEDAGYNLRTLTPNRIKITMMLSEVRAGNFGTFKPGVPVERDNIAGWEAVLEHGSADPGLVL